MKCPSCHDQAISFIQWCRKRNAFRYQCKNCGVELRASRGTWIGFGLTVAVGLAVVGFAKLKLDIDVAAGFALVLVSALIGGVLTYSFGGYVAKGK